MLRNYKRFTINGEIADGQALKAGKDYECQLVIQGAGQTGATIKFLAKKAISDPDGAAIFTKEGTAVTTIVGANILTSTFVITGAETENLEGGLALIYGIQRTLSGLDAVVEEGKLKIEASVIR